MKLTKFQHAIAYLMMLKFCQFDKISIVTANRRDMRNVFGAKSSYLPSRSLQKIIVLNILSPPVTFLYSKKYQQSFEFETLEMLLSCKNLPIVNIHKTFVKFRVCKVLQKTRKKKKENSEMVLNLQCSRSITSCVYTSLYFFFFSFEQSETCPSCRPVHFFG